QGSHSMDRLRRSGRSTEIALLVAAALLSVAASCARVKPPSLTGTGGSTDARTAPDTDALPPPSQRDAGPAAVPDAGACTTKVQCTPPGGQYCGVIGDGCA